MLGGAYTWDDRNAPDQYVGVDSDNRLAVLREVADETAASPNQVILAWMIQSDPPVLPLIAASSAVQLYKEYRWLVINTIPAAPK